MQKLKMKAPRESHAHQPHRDTNSKVSSGRWNQNQPEWRQESQSTINKREVLQKDHDFFLAYLCPTLEELELIPKPHLLHVAKASASVYTGGGEEINFKWSPSSKFQNK